MMPSQIRLIAAWGGFCCRCGFVLGIQMPTLLGKIVSLSLIHLWFTKAIARSSNLIFLIGTFDSSVVKKSLGGKAEGNIKRKTRLVAQVF